MGLPFSDFRKVTVSFECIAVEHDSNFCGQLFGSYYPIAGGLVTLAAFLDVAMEHAKFSRSSKTRKPIGVRFLAYKGVWARGKTLVVCQRELREALSDWIALRLTLNLPIPVMAGLDLNKIAQAA